MSEALCITTSVQCGIGQPRLTGPANISKVSIPNIKYGYRECMMHLLMGQHEAYHAQGPGLVPIGNQSDCTVLQPTDGNHLPLGKDLQLAQLLLTQEIKPTPHDKVPAQLDLLLCGKAGHVQSGRELLKVLFGYQRCHVEQVDCALAQLVLHFPTPECGCKGPCSSLRVWCRSEVHCLALKQQLLGVWLALWLSPCYEFHLQGWDVHGDLHQGRGGGQG